MGRIKTTLIKRTAEKVLDSAPESFTDKFGDNKKALGHTMPSKRMRNMIAGYVTRLKRNTQKLIQE